jgi:hypothetical protein
MRPKPSARITATSVTRSRTIIAIELAAIRSTVIRTVNTRSKVHQHTEVKIHQLEERRVDGFVSGRGSARGIAPLAAAKI